MDAAVAGQGFGFVRAAGEMTWALRGLPGSHLLMAYEAKLNVFLHRYPLSPGRFRVGATILPPPGVCRGRILLVAGAAGAEAVPAAGRMEPCAF